MIDTRNPNVEFNAHDRCDRCVARAISAANKDGMELLFCRHHIEKHNLALEMTGWEISYDYMELERLTDTNKVPVAD